MYISTNDDNDLFQDKRKRTAIRPVSFKTENKCQHKAHDNLAQTLTGPVWFFRQ